MSAAPERRREPRPASDVGLRSSEMSRTATGMTAASPRGVKPRATRLRRRPGARRGTTRPEGRSCRRPGRRQRSPPSWCGQTTTSSASPRTRASPSRWPTGVAAISRATSAIRAQRQAAASVSPVISPSSTTTVVRPATGNVSCSSRASSTSAARRARVSATRRPLLARRAPRAGRAARGRSRRRGDCGWRKLTFPGKSARSRKRSVPLIRCGALEGSRVERRR